MLTRLSPPSFHTSRRPSTAPQSRDNESFRLSTSRPSRLSPSRPHSPVNRPKVCNLPPSGTDNRSTGQLFDEFPSLSSSDQTNSIPGGDQDSFDSVDHRSIFVSLTSSFTGRTQTEWKLHHDRHIESPSTWQGSRNGLASLKVQSVNNIRSHLVMSHFITPPAYASSETLDMPSISDVPATEQQQGEEVIIEEGGRGSTRHIVPSLRYPYPGPEHEATVTHQVAAEAGSITNPIAETSEPSRRFSLGGRIAQGTRRMFHHGLEPPPRPPRSSNRPSTADATLQSLSTSSTAASRLTATAPSIDIDTAPETSPLQKEASSLPLWAPRLPILQPVHEREQDLAMPISPMNLTSSQGVSPAHLSHPDVGAPSSPLSSRWTDATAPSREDLHWNQTPETGRNFPEAFPLERLESGESGHRPRRRERARHSRQSEGMINLQLASNLPVEESTEPGIHLRTPILARSPDLSPWYAIISPSSSLHLPPDAESSSSGDSKSANSQRLLQQNSPHPSAIRKGMPNFPYFGSSSASRRFAPSRSSSSSQRNLAESLAARSPPDLRSTPARKTDLNAPHALEPSNSPSQPVNRSSFSSTATSQEKQEGTESSARIRTPGSWTNEPTRTRTRSSHRDSDAPEQLLTPKSEYSSPSLRSTPGGPEARPASPFPRSGTRSPDITTRLLGSNDSGAAVHRQKPVPSDYDDKQGLQPSATLGTVSSESHYSSFHSFPSDTRLVERKDFTTPSAAADLAVNASRTTTFSAKKLLATAENFNATSAYNLLRHPPRVPESYRNYKPDPDEDQFALSAQASPAPGKTTITPATGTPTEFAPAPEAGQQSLASEAVQGSASNAEDLSQKAQPVQKRDPQLSVGLGIVVSDDSIELQHDAAESAKPWDKMIDKIIARKAKEKRSDAQEHLRKQKESIFRQRSHLIVAKAESLPGFRSRRRSSQPIMRGLPIPESVAEGRRDSAKSQGETTKAQVPASSSAVRTESRRTAGSYYHVEQPDILSQKSPQQSPIIPTEQSKRKSLVRRVFSKDGLFRFGKRHDQAHPSSTASAALTAKAKVPYEVQRQILLETAEEMATPIRERLMGSDQRRTHSYGDVTATPDPSMAVPKSAASTKLSFGLTASLRNSTEAIRHPTISSGSEMTKSTSFISTSIKAPPSVKPTDEQGTFTTPQKKLLTASASGGEGEASYDINPTQKIWKQSERLTETGRSPEKKYTIETKQKRRLDAYSSQRVASVFAGEAIAQQMDTIEPETTESTPQESQEMSSGEEEIADLRSRLRAALARQKERHSARHARPAQVASDRGTGGNSGDAGDRALKISGRGSMLDSPGHENTKASKVEN
ncbi:hypothetical protein NliqN6_0579 [Naganishia liquefaciens]|uniref:Uncharacterized protein n=1 Tax=Naganishia liquefaciens TaxID=104408 RepID=A0A8H3YDD0_9TREE|nr:hypothetical protein NliqN6_0579 [Naganishia liquefaciens]